MTQGEGIHMGYDELCKKYHEEVDRGYLARRKGGIAWKQHCAALKNLERKMDRAIKQALRNKIAPKP